jgi:hypothetical protein
MRKTFPYLSERTELHWESPEVNGVLIIPVKAPLCCPDHTEQPCNEEAVTAKISPAKLESNLWTGVSQISPQEGRLRPAVATLEAHGYSAVGWDIKRNLNYEEGDWSTPVNPVKSLRVRLMQMALKPCKICNSFPPCKAAQITAETW